MGGSASKTVTPTGQAPAPTQVPINPTSLLNQPNDPNTEYTRFIRKEKTELENILDKMKNFLLNIPYIYEPQQSEFGCKPLLNSDEEFADLFERLQKDYPEILEAFETHIGTPLLTTLSNETLSEENLAIFIEKLNFIFNELKYTNIPTKYRENKYGVRESISMYCRSLQYNFINLFLNTFIETYSTQKANTTVLNEINKIRNLFKTLPTGDKEPIPQLTADSLTDDEYDQAFTAVLNTPLPAYIEQRKGIMGLRNSKSERDLKNAELSDKYINDMKPKILKIVHKGLNKAINDSKWFNNESDFSKGVQAEKLDIFEKKIQNGLKGRNGIINYGQAKVLTVDEVKNKLKNQYNLFKSIKNKIKNEKDDYLNYFFYTIDQFEGLANLGFPLVNTVKTGRKIKQVGDRDASDQYLKERKRASRKQRKLNRRKTRKN